MTKNAYIHIPFCKNKCNYCSFVSTTNLKSKREYLNALIFEIKTLYKQELLETIYFGGGTPSLLTPKEVQEILKLLNFDKNTEITLEINPDTINFDYLKALKSTGINRVSVGIQTFNDKLLKIIGRTHSAKQAEKIIDDLKTAGFDNISIDLIYGLPEQSLNDFKSDIEKTVALNIQHVSLYGLKLEEGSRFFYNTPKNIPGEDLQADMYLLATTLSKSGFEHYEVSNFSKNGYESRHNLNYWNNSTYWGFGLAASGYQDGIRYTNEINLTKYLKNPLLKLDSKKLSIQEIMEEEIFLGFRNAQGINISDINQKFNINFEDKYAQILKKYSDKYIQKTERGYRLTNDGFLISTSILAEFL